MRLNIEKIIRGIGYKALMMPVLSNMIHMISCEEPIRFFNEDIKRVKCFLGIEKDGKEYVKVYFVFNEIDRIKKCSYEFRLNRISKDSFSKTKECEIIESGDIQQSFLNIRLKSRDESGVFSREDFYEVIISKLNGTGSKNIIYYTRAFYICDKDKYLLVLSDKDYEMHGIPKPDTKYHYSPGDKYLKGFLDLEHSLLCDLRLSVTCDSGITDLRLFGNIKSLAYSKAGFQINIILEKKRIAKFFNGKQGRWITCGFHSLDDMNAASSNNGIAFQSFELTSCLDYDLSKYDYRIVIVDYNNIEWVDSIITVPMTFKRGFEDESSIFVDPKSSACNGKFIPGIWNDKNKGNNATNA